MIKEEQPPLLEVRELVKRYDGRAVVDGLSFFVARGEIVGLLRTQRRGKTTTFRMTVGMIDPEHGRVLFDEQDVTPCLCTSGPNWAWATSRRSRASFNASPWRTICWPSWKPCDLDRRKRVEKARQLIDQFGLSAQRFQLARTLSGGERRKLEIAGRW